MAMLRDPLAGGAKEGAKDGRGRRLFMVGAAGVTGGLATSEELTA